MGRPAQKDTDGKTLEERVRELSDADLAAYIENLYEEGYAAGLKAAKPALPLFEQALRSVLSDIQLEPSGALDRKHVQAVIDAVEADYDDRLNDADRKLIEQNAERDVAVDRARHSQAMKPRAIKPSERHHVPKTTEYEAVR